MGGVLVCLAARTKHRRLETSAMRCSGGGEVQCEGAGSTGAPVRLQAEDAASSLGPLGRVGRNLKTCPTPHNITVGFAVA